MFRTLLQFALMLSFAVFSTVYADTYLKYQKTTDAYSAGGKDVPASTSEATAWIGAKQACYEDGEGHRTILTFATRTLAVINLPNKTYSTIQLDSVQSMIDDAITANAPDAQTAAAMKSMMQGMMGSMMKGAMTVTKTEQQQKIGQWQCTKFLISTKLVVGATESESWLTEQIKVDPAVLNMAKSGIMAILPGFGDIKKEIEKIKGVPVKTISTAQITNTPVKSTELLLEAAEKTAPEGIYTMPKGFTQKALLGD